MILTLFKIITCKTQLYCVKIVEILMALLEKYCTGNTTFFVTQQYTSPPNADMQSQEPKLLYRHFLFNQIYEIKNVPLFLMLHLRCAVRSQVCRAQQISEVAAVNEQEKTEAETRE